jgi:hypothetical protein
MKLFLSLLLICNICFAEDVKVVKKGETVPYDGVLFPKEKEQEIRTDLKTKEKRIITLSQLNDLNNKEIEVLNKRLGLYQEKAKEMADRELKQENNTFWKSALYFISGAVLTGVIGYGVVQAYR